MRNEIIQKLEDPNIAGGVMDSKTEEDIKKVFATENITITEPEAKDVLETRNKLVIAVNDNLSLEDLSNISGGTTSSEDISKAKRRLTEEEKAAAFTIFGLAGVGAMTLSALPFVALYKGAKGIKKRIEKIEKKIEKKNN